MPTICVDFDGVIHAYSQGWKDGTIYDPPLPGAFDGLHCLMQYAAVVIHTTRDAEQVANWLFERGDFNITWESPGALVGEFWNDQTRLLVTSRKLPALAYLDDRGVRFHSWDNAVDETLHAAGLHPDRAVSLQPVEPADVDEAAEHKENYLNACGTIAAMHKAAMGEVCGPNRGVVEDIADLRTRALQAEAERDGAYRERAQLLAWLAAIHSAVIAPALDLDEPGWWILYLATPTGQASWHISPRDAGLFAHVERVEPDDPRAQWDGHTTAEKYQRIAALTAELTQRCGPECAEMHTYAGRCEAASTTKES